MYIWIFGITSVISNSVENCLRYFFIGWHLHAPIHKICKLSKEVSTDKCHFVYLIYTFFSPVVHLKFYPLESDFSCQCNSNDSKNRFFPKYSLESLNFQKKSQFKKPKSKLFYSQTNVGFGSSLKWHLNLNLTMILWTPSIADYRKKFELLFYE